MDRALLLVGAVILICILMNRWVEKLAVPSLLVFMALGMCFGENGLLHIQFDDYAAVNAICSVSSDLYYAFTAALAPTCLPPVRWQFSRWCCLLWV